MIDDQHPVVRDVLSALVVVHQCYFKRDFERAFDCLDKCIDRHPDEVILKVRYADLACENRTYDKDLSLDLALQCMESIEQSQLDKCVYIPHHKREAIMFFRVAALCLNEGEDNLGYKYAALGLAYFPDDAGLRRLADEISCQPLRGHSKCNRPAPVAAPRYP